MVRPYSFSIPTPCPPSPNSHCALFLALDGTLIDFASTPSKAVVSDELKSDLAAASVALGGAIAIFSGRKLSEMDALLSPLKFPGGAEHGAVVRSSNGSCDEVAETIPAAWIDPLRTATAGCAGSFLEIKSHSVTVHFRRAAHHENFFRQLCLDLIGNQAGDFEILSARMAIEIRPRSASKSRAINSLMAHAPFSDRRPVFIGDKSGDSDGLHSVEALGGQALDMFDRFGGRPSEVRRWLKRLSARV